MCDIRAISLVFKHQLWTGVDKNGRYHVERKKRETTSAPAILAIPPITFFREFWVFFFCFLFFYADEADRVAAESSLSIYLSFCASA
jgi:hypothetical protein